MKSSRYNIFKKTESKFILLNTLTSAIAFIDEETNFLLNANPDEIPEDIRDMFLENGFLVEDECDERKILAYYFDRDKYNVNIYNLKYTIATTYACNLACPYCYEGPNKGTETLNSEKVSILLKNIDKNLSKKDFPMLEVSLYGGEPLVAYDQCVQLMDGASTLCNEYGIELWGEMVTNGVLIDENIIETLLKPYCKRIQITMDGGREAHNSRRIRKDGGGTYDVLLHVLELLKDEDINFTLKLNVDRENAKTFTDLFDDLKERGLENVRKSIGRIYPVDNIVGDDYPSYAGKCFSPDEMSDFAYKILDILEQEYPISEPQHPPDIPKHVPCPFDREDSYTVDPYLDVYKCLEFLAQKDKVVGHVKEDGDMVFNCEYYEQMSRNPLEFEECKNCAYLPICGGGCAARSYFETGTYHCSPCKKPRYAHRRHMKRTIDTILNQLL